MYHLVRGGAMDRTEGRQAILAELLRETLHDRDFSFTQQSVRRLAAKARHRDERLAEYLLDIAASESVLAYADALFGYLQTLDAQPLRKAIDAVRLAWPASLTWIDRERFAALREDVASASGDQRIAAEWVDLSHDLADGRWSDAIPRLLTINKLVMERRGGAPWVADEAGILRVRYRDEASGLPGKDHLADLWRHPYFIGSLRAVVGDLEAA
jgi:hypothetical protein